MDMRMPVLDGYEATRRIKSTLKGAQIPIVALTASSFEDERKKIREIGMVGYIRKPFRENELFGTIGNILGINYIFDKNEDSEEGGYPLNEDELMENIANISPQIIREMKDAIDVADVDQLIEIINRIEPENKNLANYLLALANNYDYEYLQQLINNKETD
jgi:CheY-like chemotaxis protein